MTISASLRANLARNPFSFIEQTTIGLHTLYPIRDRAIYDRVLGVPAANDNSYARAFKPGARNHVPTTYLDVSASGQELLAVEQEGQKNKRHYANTHGSSHPKARLMTRRVDQAHTRLLKFTNAKPQKYVPLMGGAGATYWANIAASIMDPKKGVVLCADSHHASLVPEQIFYGFNPEKIHPLAVDATTFRINPKELEKLLEKKADQIGWLVVTAASNVTGHFNPIAEIVKVAHRYGVKVAVDVAQYAAHAPIDLKAWNYPDFIYGSGHKMDAPGSTGFAVVTKQVLDRIPTVGGGAQVKIVGMQHTTFTDDLRHRWEPGTPDIEGMLKLDAAMEVFQTIGMNRVRAHEAELVKYAIDELSLIGGLTLYGNTDLDLVPRAGVTTFNVEGLHHDIVGRALADYFNIHVRTGCFCSHPQVERLLNLPENSVRDIQSAFLRGDDVLIPGMIRASFGLYTTKEDIQRLVKALRWVIENRETLKDQYHYETKKDKKGKVKSRKLVRRDGWDAMKRIRNFA